MFYWILLRNPLPNYHRENRISFVGMSRHSSSSIAYFVVSMLDWTLILIYTFLFHNKYWNSDLIWIMNDDDINQSLERWTFIRWMKRPLTAETMIHSFFVIERTRREVSSDLQMHPYVFDGLTVLFPFEAYQCQIDYMKGVVECLVKVCFFFPVHTNPFFSSIPFNSRVKMVF